MKGDFTRDTFDPQKQFTRVLLQQGRVLLDADWNEQAAILLHYLQTLAADLIGPFGGPADGFKIEVIKEGDDLSDLKIGIGHYYVDGILCENNQETTYYTQPDYKIDPEANPLPGEFLVYLDVWERLVTSYEDGSIREAALGAADGSARAKQVWQLRVETNQPQPRNTDRTTTEHPIIANWKEWVNLWQPENRGLLKAKAKEDTTQNADACAVPPGARYRGKENQLYRVEIHRGGPVGTATFTYSRDNGSIFFPIRELSGTTAYLDHLGRDERLSLKEGDWVEVIDDRVAMQYEPNKPGLLAQVMTLNLLDMSVILKTHDGSALPDYAEHADGHPFLRRWDYRLRKSTEVDVPAPATDGALLIKENIWLTLENGIQIQFVKPENVSHTYRSGDHWLIRVSTSTGDVEWLKEVDEKGEVVIDSNGNPEPRALSPHGVTHHYAPLAVYASNQITPLHNSFCPVHCDQE